MSFCQVDIKKKEVVLQQFLKKMKAKEDVRDYISFKFINDNKLKDFDWQCDYLLIKRYKIEVINNDFVIHIDHGTGTFCTTLKFVFVMEGDKYKILPSTFKYHEKLKMYFIIPWNSRQNKC
jgi:hypothetical protein